MRKDSLSNGLLNSLTLPDYRNHAKNNNKSVAFSKSNYYPNFCDFKGKLNPNFGYNTLIKFKPHKLYLQPQTVFGTQPSG